MSKETKLSGTKVLPCSCPHTYQDERYGKGNRLHNLHLKPTQGFTCTVCDRKK